jgi:hypothetical protein
VQSFFSSKKMSLTCFSFSAVCAPLPVSVDSKALCAEDIRWRAVSRLQKEGTVCTKIWRQIGIDCGGGAPRSRKAIPGSKQAQETGCPVRPTCKQHHTKRCEPRSTRPLQDGVDGAGVYAPRLRPRRLARCPQSRKVWG